MPTLQSRRRCDGHRTMPLNKRKVRYKVWMANLPFNFHAPNKFSAFNQRWSENKGKHFILKFVRGWKVIECDYFAEWIIWKRFSFRCWHLIRTQSASFGFRTSRIDPNHSSDKRLIKERQRKASGCYSLKLNFWSIFHQKTFASLSRKPSNASWKVFKSLLRFATKTLRRSA